MLRGRGGSINKGLNFNASSARLQTVELVRHSSSNDDADNIGTTTTGVKQGTESHDSFR